MSTYPSMQPQTSPAPGSTATIPPLTGQPSQAGFQLRSLVPAADLDWLHDWMHRDHARYWGLGQASAEAIRMQYQSLQDSGHARAYLGSRAGQPAFLLEHYLPAHDELGRHYPVQPGDHGMHFMLAPIQQPRHNFSIEVLLAILELIFRDTDARRIVVEPDIRNLKIHPLNFRAGFHYHGQLILPTKIAYLGWCDRQQYAAACRRHRSGC